MEGSFFSLTSFIVELAAERNNEVNSCFNSFSCLGREVRIWNDDSVSTESTVNVQKLAAVVAFEKGEERLNRGDPSWPRGAGWKCSRKEEVRTQADK